MEINDIQYIAGMIVVIIVHYAVWRKGLLDYNPLLRLTAFIPFLMTVLNLADMGFDKWMLPAYIGGMLYTLCFAAKSAGKGLPAAVGALALSVLSFAVCSFAADYRAPDYIDEFHHVFALMRKHYVLTDYKQIDWNRLYDEYEPQFAELYKASDDMYYQLWYRFCNEFHDRHVYIYPSNYQEDEKVVDGIVAGICGRDMGFSAIRLEGGSVVACNVDPESGAYKAGIREGSRLVSCNGVDFDTYIASADPQFTSFADIDNLEFYRPVAAFGLDGEQAEIGFIADNGENVTVSLSGAGNYSDRIKSTQNMLFGDREEFDNFSWRDLGDHTACFVLSDLMDIPALKSEENREKLLKMVEDGIEYPAVRIAMDTFFAEMKAAGVERLVIDLRNNGGGDLGEMALIASYFTDEPLFIAREEYYDYVSGKTVVTEPEYTEANNMWGDGGIVLLVSSKTASAAEHFVRVLSQLDNVTVMGLTDTAGSAMGVSQTGTERLMVNFSMYKLVDENGEILIDSGADMQCKMSPDIKLSMDEEAFHTIFVEKKDYTLQQAKAYLLSRDGR